MKGITWKLAFLIVTLVVFMIIIFMFLFKGNEILASLGSQISSIITRALRLNP